MNLRNIMDMDALRAFRRLPSDLFVATGYFVHGLSIVLADEARNSVILADHVRFMVFYDALQGASAVNIRLRLAEGQFYQEGAPGLARKLAEVGRNHDAAAKVFEQAIEDLRITSEMLIKDPSGFLIVDDYLRTLKADPNTPRPPHGIISPSHPVFFIAGAEVGGDVYKRVYRILKENPRGKP